MSAFPLFIIAVALSVLDECFAEIPSEIQKCHAADVVCIAKVTTDILHRYPNGNKALGLANLEPIHLDELIVAKTEGNRPLNLNLKFTDVQVFGLSKTEVTRVVGFEKDPRTSKFEVYVTIPLLTLRAQYETDGRILLLPITGRGNAEIQFKNFKSGVKVKLNITDKDGKIWGQITKIKVHNDPELMKVRLDNLFNGNKDLGDELNKVINDNWKDVWTELESGINEGYSNIVKFLIRDVLKAISYDEFYSD